MSTEATAASAAWSAPVLPTDDPQDLRRELAAARDAARDAYRDSARLVRLLAVIGRPAAPAELRAAVLECLSEVFSADITVLLRTSTAGPRVETDVLAACGLDEDAAVDALDGLSAVGLWAAAGPTSWTSADGPEVLVDGVPVRSAAVVPLAAGDPSCGVMALLRSQQDAFTATELQLLGSVAARLRSSLEDGERRTAVSRLAGAGHRLNHSLDLAAVLDEAVAVLRSVTGGAWALAALVEHGVATVVASEGVPPGGLDTWPRRTEDLQAWPHALRRQVHLRHDLLDGQDPLTAELRHAARSLLCVPVLHDGLPVVLLYAADDRPHAFTPASVDAAALLAGYVGPALVNARLYRELASSEERLRLLTDAIDDMVAVVDLDGVVQWVSPSFARGVGAEAEHLVGTELPRLVHPSERDAVRAAMAADPGDRRHASRLEHRLRTGAGEWGWVETSLAVATTASGSTVLSSRFVGERRRLQEELRHRAYHDPLTGLANRALARQVLEEALETPPDSDAPGGVGLLFCDLDEFKAVNDRLGHEAGDDLLRQVAARLAACVRPDDVLARLGGDEFVVVLAGTTDLHGTREVGERLLGALSAPFALGREQVRVGVSVGGVVGDRRRSGALARTATEVLRDADAAMYEAKRAGRGRVAVFDAVAAREAVSRLSLRQQLSEAVRRGEIAVHYQPVVDLRTGRPVGFEALARWTSASCGTVSPAVFVPLAEESGAIADIGALVLERSCEQLARWRALPGGEQFTVSVNLSPVELDDDCLVDRVLAALRRHGVPPSGLCLEVTEGLALSERHVAQLRRLAAAGVRLALDDFGVARANLVDLTRMPVTGLKIDRSFVAGLGTARPGRAGALDTGIVRAVLALCADTGLSVVAEGVETEEQRQVLLALGCDRAQGWLFSPAVPAAAAAALVGRSLGAPPPDGRAAPAPSCAGAGRAPG